MLLVRHCRSAPGEQDAADEEGVRVPRRLLDRRGRDGLRFRLGLGLRARRPRLRDARYVGALAAEDDLSVGAGDPGVGSARVEDGLAPHEVFALARRGAVRHPGRAADVADVVPDLSRGAVRVHLGVNDAELRRVQRIVDHALWARGPVLGQGASRLLGRLVRNACVQHRVVVLARWAGDRSCVGGRLVDVGVVTARLIAAVAARLVPAAHEPVGGIEPVAEGRS